MKFFNDCTDEIQLKQLYKKLAKANHPDMGGSTEAMQEINKEYAFAIARLLRGGKLTDDEINSKITEHEAYREAIEKIVSLPCINIEIVGFWIWVTGQTKPVKDILHDAGFFFARKKIAWYFRTDEYKTKGGRKSLDEIRAKYGSEKVESKRTFTIA